MSTSTVFVAVQCFQCSTMQVKQQRRSGNKWICAVCNEKQSVQKVFARAPTAKDVRKFVQSFNMSRRCADEQAKVDDLLDGGIVDEDRLSCSPRRKKRSDWSEYLDLEEDRSENGRENEREIGSHFADGKIVTEFPEVKTRKSGSTSRSTWSKDGEGELYKPVFSKRKHIAKNLSPQDKSHWESPTAIQASKWSNGDDLSRRKHVAKHSSSKDETRNWASPSDIQASKWSKGISKEDENARTKTCILAKVRGPSSKWSEYITEEENCRARNGENKATEEQGMTKGIDILKMVMINDEMVEDDVHPDFK